MKIPSREELRKKFEKQKYVSNILAGGKTMYEYKFNDQQKIKSAGEDLREKIDSIDKKYNQSLVFDPTSDDVELKLDRMHYERPSDDELGKLAAQSLESYKDVELKKINSSHDSATRKLDDKLDEANTNFDQNVKTISQKLDEIKENSKNSLLKRGLAHSSIMENTQSGIENSKAKMIEEERNTLQKSIEKINIEKDILESQKESALESFDIAYAVKLTEKINKLKDDAAKKEQDVIKFNNQMEEIEKQFILNQQKVNATQLDKATDQIEAWTDYIGKFGPVALENKINNEKLVVAKDAIAGMDKDEALKFIQRENFEQILGEKVYKSLLKYINAL